MDKLIAALQDFAAASKAEFNRIDGLQGDGDLGITLELMVEALTEAARETTDLKQWLLFSGTKVRKKAPSTMGTLVSFALTAAGRSLPEAAVPDGEAFRQIQSVMIEEIKKRGGADSGDRTILDAFIPAAAAYSEAIENGGTTWEALDKAAAAAWAGAEATKAMAPKTGRARWLGDRALGEIDGGALLCAEIYRVLREIYG